MSYTAYSLQPGGPEEIDGFYTLDGAIDEMLRLWPEDGFDIAIEDECGRVEASMTHDAADPGLCTVTFDGERPRERYRVEYSTGPDGRVRTVVTGVA